MKKLREGEAKWVETREADEGEKILILVSSIDRDFSNLCIHEIINLTE